MKADAFGTDFVVQYSLREKETDVEFEPVIVLADLQDDASGDGVYLATMTVDRAGEYDLVVFLRGLEMPTEVTTITVEPAETTIALQSNFTGIVEQY